MKQELRLLLIAVQFYTRIPIPAWVGWQPEWLAQSARYFSVVGLVVGAMSAAVWWLSVQVVPAPVAATLAVIAAVLATGGFHEDGLADACDGFGAGGNPERILTIMKDSRVGAYGAIGIGLVLLLRVQLLASFPALAGAVVLVCGHVVSRTVAIALVTRHAYVGLSDRDASDNSPAASKAKPAVMGLQNRDVWLCALWALLICSACVWATGKTGQWATFVVGAICAGLAAWRAGVFFQKRIGGITGDCLGASQQLCECVFTLACIASYVLLTHFFGL
jgi:adenosylcobinamide-GDP ribazoletransferase